MAFIGDVRSVTFIVPAFNEQDNIADTVSEIRKAAEGRIQRFEILLINDNSTDRTGEIMDQLARLDDRIRIIHNPRNLGFGGSYKVGIAVARCDHVIVVPGDNNHSAEGITPILEKAGEADIIIPYVINREVRSPLRRFLSSAFVRLVNILFRQKIKYYNGIVLYRRALLETIRIQTDSFAFQAETILKLLRQGATYVEVGVKIAGRGEERSSAFRLKNVINVVKTIAGLYWSFHISPSRR